MSATNTPDSNTFHIGLCMAGAASAGAYTAGVMDYLLEALQEWQKRKLANWPDTPQHKVVISVMGGASAGGMTALITAASLNNTYIPVSKPTSDVLDEHPENSLYHSWVDMTNVDMMPLLLQTNDIGKNNIMSLLNSSFIDQIAARALKPNKDTWKQMPDFIDPDLKIFTTLTNLQGFKYNISFSGNTGLNNKYYMSIHNDYACFTMKQTTEVKDGWMPLDFKNNLNLDIARNAAMATGAFPIGLLSRELNRKSAHVNGMLFCRDITCRFPVPEPDCDTLNIDGGVINNEPFEKVRTVLNSKTGQGNEAEYEDPNLFKGTVLMIDPFPSQEADDCKKPDRNLINVIRLSLGAILNQVRVKPADLTNAMNENKSGQFLITPTRRRPNLEGKMEDVAGDSAIACGALSGFSGFMNKEFRVHDYFLGRFNCEMFLRNYFTVPPSALEQNDIFKKGYSNINKEQFKAANGNYQIIPIFSPLPTGVYFPIPNFSSGSDWPVIPESKIDAFQPQVKKRVQSILMNAITANGLNKFLLWIGAKVVLNRMLTNSALKAIKDALTGHELLKR
ncbi:patatin-like phospholipase family protein [Niastella caeni]|uniref:Patatin-like phospholipase family protein n=1 Tax=Niastella caeni TaxID=2569763 RepID=A0A4S8HQ84_9BACT|nr:patatin-like phospholipase family protein [Niastella caeni]THU36084.1 patatin-like phospholipase family protein [Niastella caeni]